MASLLSKVSSAVAACARRVLRATRRMLLARPVREGGGHERQLEAAADGAVGEDGKVMWRRAILMGRRCEPLNFARAIHYDRLGRPLPPPRDKAKRAAAKLCRSSDAADEAVTATESTKYVALLQN